MSTLARINGLWNGIPTARIVLAGALFINGGVIAGDTHTVVSCAPHSTLPVTFSIDCSKVLGISRRGLCNKFIVNQACKVFPAYRRLTGARLEEKCRNITYRLFNRLSFPYGHSVGGISYDCTIDYLSEHALLHTDIGPYDDHEILHIYQSSVDTISKITYSHPLFNSSRTELQYLIKDYRSYHKSVKDMLSEKTRLSSELHDKNLGVETKCKLAITVAEVELYLSNHDNVYTVYQRLISDKSTKLGTRQLANVFAGLTRDNQARDLLSYCAAL